jgi:hypothetical protein
MPRRQLTPLSAGSAAFGMGMGLLWVRSYWFTSAIILAAGGAYGDRGFVMWSQEGWLHIYWKPSGPLDVKWAEDDQFNPEPWPNLAATSWRVHFRREDDWRGVPYFTLDFAHWHAIILAGVLPAAQLLRWRRGRLRGHTGLCPACGYDLRASPSRCPECGAEPKGTTA